MNFNVYLSDALGKVLERLANRRGTSRNALIREAVEDLIAKSSSDREWPREILEWRGDPDFPSLESYRSDLPPPREDPLA